MAGRTVAALAVSGLAITASGAAALAHECINASRSDKGNAMAGSHSQAWYTLMLSDAVAGDVEAGYYTADDGACILDAYEATGSPMSFTIHVKGVNGQDGTIGARNPHEELMSDGKGIDHFFDAYGWAIFTAFDECGVAPPF